MGRFGVGHRAFGLGILSRFPLAELPVDAETVVLDLHTGEYHGLNRSAGRVLELLREYRTLAVTAGVVAEEGGAPVEQVTDGLSRLYNELTDRRLIEVESDG